MTYLSKDGLADRLAQIYALAESISRDIWETQTRDKDGNRLLSSPFTHITQSICETGLDLVGYSEWEKLRKRYLPITVDDKSIRDQALTSERTNGAENAEH